MTAEESGGSVNSNEAGVNRSRRISSIVPQPKTPAAIRMPGTASFQGKGTGGGAAASCSIRAITTERKPEEGSSSSSPARMASISASILALCPVCLVRIVLSWFN
jgi:hypothetical protein